MIQEQYEALQRLRRRYAEDFLTLFNHWLEEQGAVKPTSNPDSVSYYETLRVEGK